MLIFTWEIQCIINYLFISPTRELVYQSLQTKIDISAQISSTNNKQLFRLHMSTQHGMMITISRDLQFRQNRLKYEKSVTFRPVSVSVHFGSVNSLVFYASQTTLDQSGGVLIIIRVYQTRPKVGKIGRIWDKMWTF